MTVAEIRVNNVTVRFPVRSTVSTGAANAVGGKLVSGPAGRYVEALSDINLRLSDGDRAGVIGLNGSGKSTFLQVVAGILEPDLGDVEICGAVSTLFTSSVGLSLERNALDNIRDAGYLLGLSSQEIAKATPEIIEFAEIGDFAQLPMRSYSAGMRARVGFGIATTPRADILVIDEVLGAGDPKFYKRAFSRLEALLSDAGILVLATHSGAILRQFCNRLLWFEKGQVRMDGNVEAVLDAYNAAIDAD
ncbi:ABC transporter ATP-binding protein [Glycocaulis albus]|uniref:ABC transporter ATP-binding protein n=1 Tax=Glycocaulis albus TaxID=1382801 RepID=A0ABQ1Y0Y8_9PROT|nr:ABC transporter ATP-binding protein [Glycocaulis albus]